MSCQRFEPWSSGYDTHLRKQNMAAARLVGVEFSVGDQLGQEVNKATGCLTRSSVPWSKIWGSRVPYGVGHVKWLMCMA